MTDDSVADGLAHVLLALDILAGMAVNPDTADEVAAEEVRLGQVISRARIILNLIDAVRAPKLRAMQ